MEENLKQKPATEDQTRNISNCNALKKQKKLRNFQ